MRRANKAFACYDITRKAQISFLVYTVTHGYANQVRKFLYLNTSTVCHCPSLTGDEDRITAGPEPSSNLNSKIKQRIGIYLTVNIQKR